MNGSVQEQSLIRAVEIDDVRLVESRAKTRIRAADEIARPHALISYAAAPIGGVVDGAFIIRGSVTAKVVDASEEDSDDPPILVSAVFEIKYRVPLEFSATDQMLAEFARTNAVFNAWPYWREFVQSTVARMHLPPVILPVFRLAERRTDDRSASDKVDTEPARRQRKPSTSRRATKAEARRRMKSGG